MLFTSWLRLAAVIPLGLLLLSCDVFEPDAWWEDLEFDAEGELVADTLRFTMFVWNHSDDVIQLDIGGCTKSMALLAYDGSGLRWDQRDWRSTEQPCPNNILRLPLGAGEGRDFDGMQKVPEILGDSLPEGAYRFAVVPTFLGLQDALAHVELDLGEFELTR